MPVQIPEMWASPRNTLHRNSGDCLKSSEESSVKTELCLRHCRAETPSIHPSYHAACFYSRNATGQWHQMALQNNLLDFPSGPKTTSVRFKSLERPVTAGSKGSKVWPFLPRHIRHKNLLSCYILYFEIWKHILNTLKAFIKTFSARISH